MKDKWIKVSDRLPEVGQLVLVASRKYQEWMQPAYVLTYAGKEEIDEGVTLDVWLDEMGRNIGYPTHWQPIELPEDVEAK